MRTWSTRTGLLLAVALVAAACGGTSALTPTPTTQITVATTLAPTTTTTMGEFIELQSNGPAILRQGDRNELVEALQFYLVCNGYEQIEADGPTVSVDGVYGPVTSAMVAYVQASMRRIPTGSPDAETFHSLARRCGATRTIEFGDRTDRRVGGGVAPNDDELLIIEGEIGRTLTVELTDGAVQFSVRSEDGNVLHEGRDGPRWSAVLSDAGEYRIRVTGATTATYRLLIDYPPPPRVEIDFGPLVLAPDGLGAVEFGDEPTDVIEVLETILGEPTTDSGWEGGNIQGCSGFNRHLRWVIDPAGEGSSNNRAVFFAHFSDEGFDDTSFAQWEYISRDTENVDIGARELATQEGLSLGSSLTEFINLYGEPLILNQELGFADFNAGMTVGIDLTTEDDPADFVERVWYLSAGQDGCADFDD